MQDIPFLGQVASQGLLGLMLAISLFVNWIFYKKIIELTEKLSAMGDRLLELSEKRVDDAKEISANITGPLDLIKKNGDYMISLYDNFFKNNKG